MIETGRQSPRNRSEAKLKNSKQQPKESGKMEEAVFPK